MGYELVAGDTGSKIVLTCRDNQTQAAIDLTGKIVHLRYRIDGGAMQTKTMAIQSPPTAGKAEYQFGSSDLTAGTFQGEIQIQPGAADQLTSLLPFALQVRAPLS